MMFTKAAVALGAEPYGLGIWNAPFIDALYSGAKKRELVAFKAKVDPNGIMNPGKFFRVRPNGMNIPAAVFNPGPFSGFPCRLLSRVVADRRERSPPCSWERIRRLTSLDFELTTHACAKCGNCIAVCPAYLVTRMKRSRQKGRSPWQKSLSKAERSPGKKRKLFLCACTARPVSRSARPTWS